MTKLDDSIALHMRVQTIENKDWGVLTREDGVFFHPRGILRAVTQYEADEDALVRLVNTIVRQYDQWLTHGVADDIQQTQQALCCAAAEHSDDMHAIFADPLCAWLGICLRGRLTQTDTTDTHPVAAPAIPHEQPSPLPAQQATPTRRQGAPKKQLFPSEETLVAKRAEFLREYNLRFPSRQKTITTTVASDDFNRFVIDMALTWGDEFPALQEGMGSAWEHFLASMDFQWQLKSKTWKDQIHKQIYYAWKIKKKKQNKPQQTTTL